MIGNLNDAALAANGLAEPIGIGSYRRAYLINGVVYKVTYDGDGRGDNANLYEWDTYVSFNGWPDLPKGIRVPETSLWPVGGMPVIAMTYVDGAPMGECFCAPGEDCCDC